MKTGIFLLYFGFSALLSFDFLALDSFKLIPKFSISGEKLDQSVVSKREGVIRKISNKEPETKKTQTKPRKESAEKTQKALNKEGNLKNEIKQNDSPEIVTQKIKGVFEDFIKILESRSVDSKEYKKAVKFLENSLYNEASFESLKLLAQVYYDRKDTQNQINVLNIISVNYSNNPESFYLLAMAYKSKYLQVFKEPSIKTKKELLKEQERYKEEIIKNLNQALKIDSKHIASYLALLEVLMTSDPKTEEKLHTRASLSVVLDMLKNLKDNKYYSDLCKAYYDNQFFKQSLKACARSVKKNPKDPISPLILSLSLEDQKKKQEKLVLTAEAFPNSFFVQYKTGLYFMGKSPRSAILYLTSAHKLNPNHVTLNKILAKLLYDNGEEERSYDYFLSACLLTEALFLEEFRKAKSGLRRKSKVDLVVKFKKGIKECYQKLKEKKKKKA